MTHIPTKDTFISPVHSSYETKSEFQFYFLIVLMPFLMFYSIIPFLSGLTMGSDYLLFPIRYQMELFFSMKTGSFPLYAPGFASGHSSSALTLGQIYHPLSHIASIMPGYWEGKAIEWNSFLKLLSLGLTQLVLFLFLRRLRLSSLFSFLFSFITIYNLKLMDLFRHGAPLEAFTGHLVLCAVIGWHFIQPTKWAGPLCIIGATYLLICSGHPEEMYYGFLGTVLFMCVAPFFIPTMLSDRGVDLKIAFKFWIQTGFYIFLGLMLSSAYTLPFYFDFVSDNNLRVGQDYMLADHNLDTFIGTINNFFLPLRSLVYGAFGGSSLFLVAFLIPVLWFFKVKIPRSVWFIWGLLVFMFLFMQGKRTPVHRLVWEYLPLASSIRTAGRISMIMPFFIMLLLAWVAQAESFLLRFKRSSVMLRPFAMLAYSSLVMTVIYYLVYIAGYHILSSATFVEEFIYAAGHFRYVSYFWLELMIVIAGISLLAVLAVYSMRASANRTLGIVLIIVTIAQVGIVLKYRTAHWIGKKYASPTFKEMQEQKKTKLDYLYDPGGGMQSSIVINHLDRTFMEPFLGKILTHIVSVKNQDEAYQIMEQERLPQQLFIEGYDSEKARMMTEGAKDMKEGRVKLTYSAFNRLQFQIVSQAPAFFGLHYPYTGYWNAKVNDKDVPVYRANGAAHAIEIPKGESVIEFRYWSHSAFWGMTISCMTFALIGFFVCFRSLKGLQMTTGIVAVLAVSAGGFMLWYTSLYSGDNLKTEYAWTYEPPMKINNVAYGKRSWVMPPAKVCRVCAPDRFNTRLVDGNRIPMSGFITSQDYSPDWFIDLHKLKKIKTLFLYGVGKNSKDDAISFKIALSDDGHTWRTSASMVSPANGDGPLNIVFNKLQTARYIMIKLSGESMVSIDEVEIYGP